MERFKAQQRRAKASPQRSDFESEFGKHRVKDEPDGSWTFNAKTRREIRKAHEMQAESRKIDVEEGHKEQAKMAREKLIRNDGRMLEFPEELVDRAKNRFKGKAGKSGKAVPLRFSMSDAFGRYEQGPDGLWFLWNGGWEPTNLWRKGVTSPQRDPDGNIWREGDLGWELWELEE